MIHIKFQGSGSACSVSIGTPHAGLQLMPGSRAPACLASDSQKTGVLWPAWSSSPDVQHWIVADSLALEARGTKEAVTIGWLRAHDTCP